ncbi:MAG TPA: aldehyde dehydrogenase family protein, partial [Candidatus Nocardiopsis merdipullorum]|nr:aldehyde dehydrogenase family protein [Candidatus Nocardiopsis merdipullorum]
MRSLYIDGSWQDSASSEALDVVNPATEQVIDAVPAGAAEDVDRAVAAAAAAFPTWSELPPAERVAFLAKALEMFNSRIDDIAATLTRDMGAPKAFARKVQAGLPALMFKTYIDLVQEHGERYFTGEEVGNSLVVHEPIGVVGAITPWNYPLHQIVLKVVPALLAGNTIVLKPSEI